MQWDAPKVALGEILAPGVEGGAFGIWTLGAEADQTPAHADQLAGSSVAALPDDGLGSTGCDVVATREGLIGCRRGMEVVNDRLVVGDSVVAPAHAESVPQQGPGGPHPSRADQRPAVGFDEIDAPPSPVVQEVEQDPWRCSPATLPSPRDGHLLLYEMAVREAQIHLGGSVAAQLTTQRAWDHQIASGELLSAGWDAAGAFLARHHVDVWLDRSLLAVVH